MLTTLELENFRGIADRQRVDFAPLTLLFGANSAGKSTILQALVYLHELIEHGQADVEKSELGGEVLEFGGFARLVHKHETHRSIVLRIEFETPIELNVMRRDLSAFPFSDLNDEIEKAWLELTIDQRTLTHHVGPIVSRVKIGVGDDPEALVSLEIGPTLREGEPLFAWVNLFHSALKDYSTSEVWECWEEVAVVTPQQQELFQRPSVAVPAYGPNDESNNPQLAFAISRNRVSALPAMGEPIQVLFPNEDEPSIAQKRWLAEVQAFLEMVVLGTVVQLGTLLRRSIYIGPLRAMPPRGVLIARAGRLAQWADGLAAWNMLLSDSAGLIDKTNEWLMRLGAGCKVLIQRFADSSISAEDLSVGHVDSTVRRLILESAAKTLVLPSEVGAGVSQIIPVIVAALVEGRVPFVAVEQPEIHVHPALQTGLGDLLILTSASRQFLVETHSEHLILRLLRRIRETTEKELPEGAPAFSADKLSVLYVENGPEGVRIRRLRVDDSGEFQDRWPKGFFAERMGELL